jgi:hypothetical protein
VAIVLLGLTFVLLPGAADSLLTRAITTAGRTFGG